MDSNSQFPTMWTTGYLKNGMKVSFTFPIRNEMEATRQALEITNKLLADGFLMDDPAFGALEAGEKREKVSAVLRRQYLEDDGTTVPVIDIYPDNPALGRRCVFYYLNDSKQITDFEEATGLKLAEIPLYSESQLNRVEKPELAKKFLVPVKTTVSAVFKDNPAYDADAPKKKAKHLFIRWEAANALPPPQPTSVPAGNPTPSEQTAEPDYAAMEAEQRKKAATALDNDLVTIYKATYQPTHNGMGAPSWTATARDINGTSFPVTVGERGAALVKKAGYTWPITDADDLAIEVITELVDGKRRIQSVKAIDGTMMAETPQNAPNANVSGNNVHSDDVPAWLFDRTKLLYQVGQSKEAAKFPHEERGATVDKMYKAGEFDKVSNLDSAVTMVTSRLAAHRKEKQTA